MAMPIPPAPPVITATLSLNGSIVVGSWFLTLDFQAVD
jgi:hypothetical protein